jgi:hypothetical protein
MPNPNSPSAPLETSCTQGEHGHIGGRPPSTPSRSMDRGFLTGWIPWDADLTMVRGRTFLHGALCHSPVGRERCSTLSLSTPITHQAPCEERPRVKVVNGHLHTQTTDTYCVLRRPRPARKSQLQHPSPCAHVANCVRLPSPVQPQQKTLADHCGAKSASTPKLQGPRPSARPRRSAEYGRDTLPKGSRGVSRLPCDTFAAVQRGCPILKPTQPGTAGTECVLLAGIFLPRTPLDWPGTSHSWRLTCFDSPSDKLN